MKMPNNLRKIRESQTDKNLRSGNKIAELLGISPQYYYSLETGREGKRLNSEHLNKLIKIFNVSADEILGGAEIDNGSSKQPQALQNSQLAMVFRAAEELTEEELKEVEKYMKFTISQRPKK
ncbi:helix-turn-helix domain-containing protein [Sporomusa acidovorans]|uniref:HTH cro/C1-type domain-containing protein n=1 Tax=Sporomusa acidovorans (strain ATCC 49682 / DSM 3132 / Mol) TaxID=1123286 RepID=A0ABZ3J8G0_SPOA4|nr:helix-turn-helix transcriptional regulator [Sporomusa acidovorans]OZC16052.1 helix-turn-helix protein [Sporomusa acidovorans DSM 3132]SDD88235.1 Helix-turn-helix [Sporomusa acidovorans]